MSLLLKEFAVVAIGGAVGSVFRFVVSRSIQMSVRYTDYPWGIFIVNVTGCLLIGILYGLLVYRVDIGPLWRAGLLIGVLGGYTTFSSFSLDTITLLESGDILAAVANIILTLICCLAATALGLLAVRALIP